MVYFLLLTSFAYNCTNAYAEPTDTALQEKAKKLRSAVERLEIKHDLAVENYIQAQEALNDTTVTEVLSQQQVKDWQLNAQVSADRSAQRVRAIYQSGGLIGIASTFLESKTFDEAAVRWNTVESLIQTDAESEFIALTRVRLAVEQAQQISLSKAGVVAQKAAAAQAATDVVAVLDEQQRLLANTDAAVLRILKKQQLEKEARELSDAASRAHQLGIGGITDAFGRGLEGATATSQTLPNVAAPNRIAAVAIRSASTRLGMSYVWGATGPTTFDCSGLMQWSYAQAGLVIPRTSREQYAQLPRISLSALLPGDLVFYATDIYRPETIRHVGMYIGNGLSLYAPRTGSVVKIGSVGYGKIIGAARPSLVS
ncbi:MAG: NlpC/P60 family protein [Actinomycetota bacterium]